MRWLVAIAWAAPGQVPEGDTAVPAEAPAEAPAPAPAAPAPAPAPTEVPPIALPPEALRPPPPPDLGERLVAEAAEVRELLTGRSAMLLLLVVIAALAAVEGVHRLARAARLSGYDVDRRLTVARIVLVLAIGGWATATVVRHVLLRAPLFGAALVLVFAGGALLGLARTLQHAAGGLLLVLAQRVREGDRLTVGETTGTVEHAGPLRLRLRRADGAIVYLPTSLLDEHAVVVSSPRRTRAVDVRLARPRPPTVAEREALRQVAVLCPFRQAGTEVAVEAVEGGVRVQLWAWSARAATEAERWLERHL